MDKNIKKLNAPDVGTLTGYVKSILIGLISGQLLTVILILLSAFVMTKINIPLKFTEYISAFCLAAGGFAGGFVSGYIIKRKGYIAGALNSLVMILIMTVFNIVIFDMTFGLFTVIKMVLFALLCMTGAVIGVNRNKKNSYGI